MELNYNPTKNALEAMIHEGRAEAFRQIAEFIEEIELTATESAALLRELADEAEAQAIVVRLRDQMGKPKS